ncbi:MAG: hypothetical protein ABJF04_16265 [Reichenbachiella sp.]
MKEDKENERKFESEEERASYYHEIIPTHLGYMTQAEYDRECAPNPTPTEEDWKRWEEYEHPEEKLTSKERTDIISSKMRGKMKRFFQKPASRKKIVVLIEIDSLNSIQHTF